MAITRAETQVQWSAANSVSVGIGGTQTSDEINLDATCVAAQITVKADNSGTPAADDQIDFYLLQTSGDPDGASTDEFDTTGHALFLCRLDTYTTGDGEDPAIKTVPLPIPQKGAKLYATGADSGTSTAITVSATITEQRAA
jgi:hypothetical protein